MVRGRRHMREAAERVHVVRGRRLRAQEASERVQAVMGSPGRTRNNVVRDPHDHA